MSAQVTLGQLIDQLQQFAPNELIPGLENPHSYRGYYEQLAFQRGPIQPAKDVLATVVACVDQVFNGWKGGDYQMRCDTLVWIAIRGCCGDQCFGYKRGVILLTKSCD